MRQINVFLSFIIFSLTPFIPWAQTALAKQKIAVTKPMECQKVYVCLDGRQVERPKECGSFLYNYIFVLNISFLIIILILVFVMGLRSKNPAKDENDPPPPP